MCRRRPLRQQQQPSRFDDGDSQDKGNPLPNLLPSPISTPISSGDEVLNMEQLRLFHHFQSSTQHTLPVVSQIWESILPKAFEYKYLMHAALCLAARHLEYSCQHNERIAEMVLSRKYLSHTLRLFREALSSDITNASSDAILCTSFMLYFEAWSDTAFLPLEIYPKTRDTAAPTSEYSASEDQLFTLSESMRHACMYAMSGSAQNSTMLNNVLLYRPIMSVYERLSSFGRVCNEYDAFFDHLWQEQGNSVVSKIFCDIPTPQNFRYGITLQDARILQMSDYQSSDKHAAYASVTNRLSALLSLLPIDLQETSEPSVLEICPDLLPDVSRIVYTFPLMFHPKFTDMLFENDTRILVLLYHFFRMVNQLLPKEECWWAARRAESFEVFLKQKLWGSFPTS